MNPETVGLIFIALLVVLLFSGVHIAFAMGICGFLGTLWITGFPSAIHQVASVATDESSSFILSCIPLYILMGMIIFHSGIAGNLYDAMYKFVGRLPGGLAVASTFGCAAFGAVSGASTATAATMASIVLPSMKKYKYDVRLSVGTLAASGTLGILIPPSIPMVVYGVMTEQSIGALFIAGILPGVLSAIIYAAMIVTRAKLNPSLAPPGERFTWREQIAAFKGVWHVAVIFALVIGGIYLGVFTPTEAAGIGCFFASVFGAMKKMGWNKFRLALYDTGKLTAMILLLIIGGIIFGRFLAASGLVGKISEALGTLPYSRYVVLAIVLLMYFALGMIMDTLAMVILTLPLTFPVIMALGFNPIWFGIIVIKSMEIGLVTPPVGLNAYVVAGVAKDVRLEDIFAGLVWFIAMDIVTLAILIAFPQITLWLPLAMMD